MLLYFSPHTQNAPPRTEQRTQPEARSRLWSRERAPPPPADCIRWTFAITHTMCVIQNSYPKVVSGYSSSYGRSYARQRASSCVWECHHHDWPGPRLVRSHRIPERFLMLINIINLAMTVHHHLVMKSVWDISNVQLFKVFSYKKLNQVVISGNFELITFQMNVWRIQAL